MNAQEYIYAMDRQKLFNLLYTKLCVRDFEFETEYSVGEQGKIWCCDNYQGDCMECWNSRVVIK